MDEHSLSLLPKARTNFWIIFLFSRIIKKELHLCPINYLLHVFMSFTVCDVCCSTHITFLHCFGWREYSRPEVVLGKCKHHSWNCPFWVRLSRKMSPFFAISIIPWDWWSLWNILVDSYLKWSELFPGSVSFFTDWWGG